MQESSSIPSINSDIYAENVDCISNFKGRDFDRIKASNVASNALFSYEEKLSSPFSWGMSYGTQFNKTVDAIDLTSKESLSRIKETILKSSKNKKLTKSDILNICNLFQKEIKLGEGLKKIQSVYEKKYKNEKGHEGVAKIISLGNEFSIGFKEVTSLYRSLVKEFIEANPDTKLPDFVFEPQSVLSKGAEFSNLVAYCDACHPKIDIEDAQTRIKEGEKLFKDIMSGEVKKPDGDKQKALTQVANINWFLMAQSLEKGQGFQEGAFVIEDKNDRLFNFITRVEGCAPRLSSHFDKAAKIRRVSEPFGLDLYVKGWVSEFLAEMPANKRTLLINQISDKDGKKALYLKPENYGASELMHAEELVVAQGRKALVSVGLAEGLDDAPEMRKERVPSVPKKLFNQLIDKYPKTEEGGKVLDSPFLEGLFEESEEDLSKEDLKYLQMSPEEIKTQASIYGIAFMIYFVKLLEDNVALPLGQWDSSDFINSIKEYDHLDKRTGREVYFSADEVEKML